MIYLQEKTSQSQAARRCMCDVTVAWVFVLLQFITVPCVQAQQRTVAALTENWYIRQLESNRPDIAELSRSVLSPDSTWLIARMPAQVHDVLLEHGKISDPHVGKNAAESAWVGEKDWAYACVFKSSAKSEGPVFLRFEGLDTLAAAYLNGAEIGRFDNMYRKWSVDVRDRLAGAGQQNVLLVVFSSPLHFVNEVKIPERYEGLARHKFLRKSHGDFSSYLGASPHSVKVGIYRDVVLDIPGPSWIEDVWVRPELSEDFRKAQVHVQVETAGQDASVDWTLTDPAGRKVNSGAARVSSGLFNRAIQVEAPVLWWPRTHGTPNLYELEIILKRGNETLDSRNIRFGIRSIKAVMTDPQTGEKRFRFDINGLPIFLRGACWAPVEGMTHCWRPERATRLLDWAEQGRMNILRIWGEGHIPPQQFYDECDRRGILIWQDFMFGYDMHPSGEPAFDENCRAEIEGMLRDLRNHPSILLWVGGNENYMGWDFKRGTRPTVGLELFEGIMPEACAKLDPTRIFHPSSPYGGGVPNWPLEGDWHDYTTLKFCPEASVPLFASEVGRASAPPLSSMKLFLSDEELWPRGYDPAVRTPGKAAWPPMWQYRSVGGSWDKVGAVEQYCDPKSAEELVRALGMAHGEYLRDRVERQRRGVPDGAADGNRRCWGNMVWRLNDSWPIIYWSVIDYYLEPKIPFYFLRRAYDPVLISFERTADWIAVWIVNDSAESVAGLLEVRRRRFDGQTLGQTQTEVSLKPGQAKRCLMTTDLGPVYLRTEFLEASFGGKQVTYLLTGERYLHLPKAKLAAQTTANAIEISTDVFTRDIRLQADNVTGAVFEDNFFDMSPGQKRVIRIMDAAGARGVTVAALNAEPVHLQMK